MTSHEWDRFVRWFRHSRLRLLAFWAATLLFLVGAVTTVGNAVDSGWRDTYTCNGKPATEAQYHRHILYCDTKYHGGKVEWNLGLMVPFAALAGGIFLVPLLNAGAIEGRRAIRGWQASDNRRLRRENADHRARLRAAEAVSDQAEREAVRLQRDLDSLMESYPHR
jgi:hypothetical protein